MIKVISFLYDVSAKMDMLFIDFGRGFVALYSLSSYLSAFEL